MSERLRRDEIPEREGLLQRRELQIVSKSPAASGQGCGARRAANPFEQADAGLLRCDKPLEQASAGILSQR